MSARVLAQNAAWSLAYHVFSRGSLVLAAVLLARSVETQSFASYSYFQLTISMFAAYAALGLGSAASRLFAEAGAQGSGGPPPLGTLWALSLAMAFVAFLAVLAAPAGWMSAGLDIPRWLLALGVLALALQVVPGGGVIGLEKYREAAGNAAVAGAITLAGAVSAAALHDARVAMWGIVVSSLAQTIGDTRVVVRTMGLRMIKETASLRAGDVRRVLGISGPMFLVSMMAGSGSWIVGRLLLRGSVSPHEFALFTIGLQWFAMGLVLPGVFARVLLPRLVKIASVGSAAADARRMVRAAVWSTTGAATAMALAGLVAGPWVIQLYGARYSSGTWVIAAFMGAAIITAPANSLGSAILARNGQWVWLMLTALWLAVLIAAGILLRPLGAVGGGVTYAVAYGTLTCGAFLVARRRRLV